MGTRSPQTMIGMLNVVWFASRIKLLVHDGFGVWCAARRLNAGRFVWPREVPEGAAPMTLTQAQFDALVVGLPWQRLEHMRVITRM